jgi:histone deacetylase 6
LYVCPVKGVCKSSGLANRAKADVVKEYIKWAVEKDYGIIDVNIPKHTTGGQVSL